MKTNDEKKGRAPGCDACGGMGVREQANELGVLFVGRCPECEGYGVAAQAADSEVMPDVPAGETLGKVAYEVVAESVDEEMKVWEDLDDVERGLYEAMAAAVVERARKGGLDDD